MSTETLGDSDANDLIPLMLGAIRMLDAFVEAAEARADGEASPISPDDPFVSAAMGLVSLRRSLRRWRLHAIHDHQQHSSNEAAPQQLPPEAISLR